MIETPMDRATRNGLQFGANLIESFALTRLAHQTLAYEADLSRLGGGAPPMAETVSISIMWADVARCSVGDA